MAAVSMADVKQLRERLGAGMVDCKNALVEAEGDIERAIDILRLKGLKGVAKRGDRAASEGLVAINRDGDTVTAIELVCETDFVAKNEKFIALGDRVLAAVSAAGAADAEAGNAAALEGKTVAEVIGDEAAIIGERLELRRVARISGENAVVYLHRTSKDLPPQIGVAVCFEGADVQAAESIAQHISFASPLYLDRASVPSEEVEKERKIVTEISLSEGKPEAALPKIVEGRLGAFFKQIVLEEQVHALDADKRDVNKFQAAHKIKVTSFLRCKVGS